MASSTKTTFGASIVPVAERQNNLPMPSTESPSITPAASHEDLRAARNAPYYPDDPIPRDNHQQQQPPQPAVLAPQLQLQTNNNTPLNTTHDPDLEAGTPLTQARTTTSSHQPRSLTLDEKNPFTSKVSLDCNKECQMWPSKQTLLQTKLAEKRRKRAGKCCAGCGPLRDFWARFTARQKLIIKILLALFIVGIAVAVGVGISVAVNGTVYAGSNQTQNIPQPKGS